MECMKAFKMEEIVMEQIRNAMEWNVHVVNARLSAAYKMQGTVKQRVECPGIEHIIY